MQPLAQKYASLTAGSRVSDTNSIEQAYERQVADINSYVRSEKSKLAEIGRKIARARTSQSRENHVQQRRKQVAQNRRLRRKGSKTD